MEKKNVILMVIVVILALLVGFLGGYIVNDLTGKGEPNTETNCGNNNNKQNKDNIDDSTKQKIYGNITNILDELIASEIGPYDFQQESYNQNYIESEYGRSRIAWSIIESDNTIDKVYDSEEEGGTGSLSVNLNDYSTIYSKVIGFEPNVNDDIYLVPADEKYDDITISDNRVYGHHVTGRYQYDLKFNNLVYSDNIYTLNIDYIADEPDGNTEIEVKFEIEKDNNYKIKSLIIRKK